MIFYLLERGSLHIPVMKEEVLKVLRVREGGLYFDCTFGQGGHSLAILKAGGVVIALDRDSNTEIYAKEIKKEYPNSFFWVNTSFTNLLNVWQDLAYPMKPDGILLDLGFSSNQIEDAKRGFSFLYDSELDMRYDTNSKDITALEYLNTASEKELAKIFWEYGEEPFAKIFAKKICAGREKVPLKSCFDLLKLLQPLNCQGNKHFATKIFQALRIFINDEFLHIQNCLSAAMDLIKFYGRIAVISFHSLEDRIIKGVFDNKNLMYPSDNEVLRNPRSRSAKLRWFINIKEVD